MTLAPAPPAQRRRLQPAEHAAAEPRPPLRGSRSPSLFAGRRRTALLATLLLLAFAPLATAAPPAALPLACPAGAERKGDPPPEGFEQWCEGKDPHGRGRREGPARSWYDDGALWKEQSFREGVPDGSFRELHRNGKLAREGTYAMGEKVGTWRIFFESGALEEESEWTGGVAHGRFVAFWPNGTRRTEGRRCGGAQCGRWRTFDMEGKPLGEIVYDEQTRTP